MTAAPRGEGIRALIEIVRAEHREQIDGCLCNGDYAHPRCYSCRVHWPCLPARLAEALAEAEEEKRGLNRLLALYKAANRDGDKALDLAVEGMNNAINRQREAEAQRDAAQARATELERENAQLLDTAAKVETAADGHLEHCSCSQSVALLADRVERLAGERDSFREVVESMVDQFSYDRAVNGKPGMCTGGLSALEEAFAALGWDDPHAIDDPVWCDADVTPRCPKRITCGLSVAGAYKRLCSEHGSAALGLAGGGERDERS